MNITAIPNRRYKKSAWPRLILPLVLILVGVLILTFTRLEVIDSATDPVGPRFLPYLSGSAVAVGGLIDLMIRLRTNRTADIGRPDEEVLAGPGRRRKSHLVSYGLILVGIAVWIYATVLIGYGLSSVILMAMTATAFGLRKPVQMVILIVVTIGTTYAVFAELLQVQLTLIGW